MSKASFIAGDWGTSRLRLYLCDATGHVLARGEGEGGKDFSAMVDILCQRVGIEKPRFA